MRRREWRRASSGFFGFGIAFPLRGALDVAGAFPAAEFLGVAGVFVVHDGVETADLFAGFGERLGDGFGVFDFFAAFRFLGSAGAFVGGAIGAQVRDEAGGQLFGDEPGDERGFGGELGGGVAGGGLEFFQVAVGGGDDAGVAVGGGGEVIGKAGHFLVDAGGGAPDVPAIEPDAIEDGGFGGGAAADLAGAGVIDVFEGAGEGGGVPVEIALGSEVGFVIAAEDGATVVSVVATLITVFHNEGLSS